MMLGGGTANSIAVMRDGGEHLGDRAVDVVDQRGDLEGVLFVYGGQLGGQNVAAVLIHGEVQALALVATHSCMGWQQTLDYITKAGAERAMSRYKRSISDTFRSHGRPAQQVENQDEAEAMLAAQMVGVHWMAMELLRQVGGTGSRLPPPAGQLNGADNLAVKLLRTYTTHLEALKRYRLAGEQRVVVQHQHVNVTADQAAVQVNSGGYPAPRGYGTDISNF
jgi:hypothetical protein